MYSNEFGFCMSLNAGYATWSAGGPRPHAEGKSGICHDSSQTPIK